MHRRLKYFNSVSAYLELAMYICVFIFIPNDKKSNMQQQAGAIAVFLAWINFTWFLKRFQTYGIYIIMVNKILITFVKVKNHERLEIGFAFVLLNNSLLIVDMFCAFVYDICFEF